MRGEIQPRKYGPTKESSVLEENKVPEARSERRSSEELPGYECFLLRKGYGVHRNGVSTSPEEAHLHGKCNLQRFDTRPQ